MAYKSDIEIARAATKQPIQEIGDKLGIPNENLNVDGGAIVPMFANHIHALSKKVAHPDNVAGTWETDGNKSAERWWFA